jgi:hypothetical protein
MRAAPVRSDAETQRHRELQKEEKDKKEEKNRKRLDGNLFQGSHPGSSFSVILCVSASLRQSLS